MSRDAADQRRGESPDRPEADLAVRLAGVDLNLLPPLLALLEERSVTRAAQRLSLSQPALSHALARLRRLLGDELLVRDGQHLVVTPHGLVLAGLVKRALTAVSEEVLSSPAFDPAHHAREFVLSMTPSTAYVLSPILLRIVSQQAPLSTFRVVDPREPGDGDLFDDAEIDLALVADIVASEHRRATLYFDEWVIVTDRANRAIGDRVTVEDLAVLPHVGYHSKSLRTSPYMALAAAGIRPRMTLVSPNFLLLPLLVEGSGQIAIVQRRLAAGLARHLPLRIFDFPLPIPPLGIDLIQNPRLAGDSGLDWLTGALRRAMAAPHS